MLTHSFISYYDGKAWMSIFSLHIEFIHFLTDDARLSCFASDYDLAPQSKLELRKSGRWLLKMLTRRVATTRRERSCDRAGTAIEG